LALLVICLSIIQAATGQEKQTVQVKVFDQQLKPFPNIELSLNGKAFFAAGTKGSAFIELHTDDLPPESVTIRNNQLEAASWNYSKGILEIIVRKKSYELVEFVVRDNRNQPVPDTEISFSGKSAVTIKTNRDGKFQIPIALDESNPPAEKFSIAGYTVSSVIRTAKENTVSVNPIVTAPQPAHVADAEKPEQINENYFRDFDLSKLDSIKSLTVFYAVFKNYHVSNLNDDVKRRLDAKLKTLVEQLSDSLNRNAASSFIGKISDSSFVSDDITNLLAQAQLENEALDENRGEFDEKIQMIRDKLEAGIGNLNAETRTKLLSDLRRLEQILEKNENDFYENQSHYRLILSSINENFLNYENLENRLSMVEAQRLEEQKLFRKRILQILAVVAVFAVFLVLLVAIRNKLKAQKKELEIANTEIKRMNENLEDLVFQRTKLLQEANRELDLFLYKASHDLRAPICSIIGLSNLATASPDPGESRDLFEKVVETAHSMDRLLNKLRIISEINQPGNYSTVDLFPMVEAIKDHFASFARQNRIDFNIDCPPDLQLYSNEKLTEAILFNLIENALFYSAAKRSGTPRVEFTARIVDTFLEFSIHDNGIGIDKGISAKIFDMFFIGHEGSRGNGLGLYIVEKAVHTLKGSIAMESEVNSHTRFIVRIPMRFDRAPATRLSVHASSEIAGADVVMPFTRIK
jgi:signal transduction histidine kinase